MTPMRSAPAAISFEPRPFAIAIAPNAFKGCTDGKLVDEGHGEIEEPGRQEHSRRRQAVLDDQRHRDRDEDADVGDGACQLASAQPQNVALLTPVAITIRIAAAAARR